MLSLSHSIPAPGSPETGSAAGLDRKLKLLLRAGLFGEDTRGAQIKRACSAEELIKAYRLVHKVFVAAGYLRPEPAGLRLRIFETTSDTATFIAEKAGEVVGVLSVVGDSTDLGLPSDAAFKPELDQLRARGLRLCEVTNQAVAEEYRRSAVPTELMRCAMAHMVQAGFHQSVATVSPGHHGFYDLLGFQQFGVERSYSAKLADPVIALQLELDTFRQSPDGLGDTPRFFHHFAGAGNQFLSAVADWGRQARRQFLNADLLQQLFVHDRNFLAECTAKERKILNRRWGQEMFQFLTDCPDPAPRAAARDPEGDSRPAMSAPGPASPRRRLSVPGTGIFSRNPGSCHSRRTHRVRTPPPAAGWHKVRSHHETVPQAAGSG